MSDINSLTLKYVETSSEVMQLATKIARDAQDVRHKAIEKVAGVVHQLKKVGLVDEHEIKLASDQLANPASALDILTNVVTKYSSLQAQVNSMDLGKAAHADPQTPAGSCHHKNANYVGYVRGSGEVSARDRALLALIDRR